MNQLLGYIVYTPHKRIKNRGITASITKYGIYFSAEARRFISNNQDKEMNIELYINYQDKKFAIRRGLNEQSFKIKNKQNQMILRNRELTNTLYKISENSPDESFSIVGEIKQEFIVFDMKKKK